MAEEQSGLVAGARMIGVEYLIGWSKGFGND